MSATPSRSCRLGEGDDVYIWRCEGARRVLIRHRCAILGKYQCTTVRETSECGGRTPLELTIGPARIDQCANVPAERRWRVRPR